MLPSAPVGELIPLEAAAQAVGRNKRTLFLWIELGWLEPHKVKGDQRTFVDSEKVGEAAARANRRPRAKS